MSLNARSLRLRALKITLLPLALAASMSHSAMQTVDFSNWAATDARAFVLPGMTDLGASDAAEVLTLMVTLKQQNKAALDVAYRHITTPGDPLYKHYLSPRQYADAFAPNMRQASAVIDYLHHQGFTDIELAPNRMQIRMHGTVAQAQTAFNTQIHDFTYNGKTVVSNVVPAQVPAVFADTVLGVVGLSTVPTMHLNKLNVTSATPGAVGPVNAQLTGYPPLQFQKWYDVGNTPDGSKASIAIMADGPMDVVVGKNPGITDPNNKLFDSGADLRIAEKANSLPYVPVTIIKTGFNLTDSSGQVEWDLDTQASTGMAGNVKMLYIYDGANLLDVEILAQYNRFATDNLAQAASSSFGTCEPLTQTAGTVGAYDQVTTQMALQGQTMFASTGDTGSGTCPTVVNTGAPTGAGVALPADLTNVVGVGGTDVISDTSDNFVTEVAWNGSGGGTSIAEKAGSWQQGIVPLNASGFKGIPDVSMSGGDTSKFETYASGSPSGVNGTSLSSPLALGVWARLQSARVTATNPNPLGFAAPDLYALAVSATAAATGAAPTGFRDIIAGANGMYQATPGWDYVTGIGTFDVANINAALKKVSTLPPEGVQPALGGDVCAVPGFRVANGEQYTNGDAVPGQANKTAAQDSHNVLAAYLSEHYDATRKADGFTFSIDVGSLATTGASSNSEKKNVYFAYYTTADGVRRYAAYEITADPTATGATNFSYGYMTEMDVRGPSGTPLDYPYNQVLTPVQQAYTSGVINGNQAQIFVPRSALPAAMLSQPFVRIFAEVDTESTFLDQGSADQFTSSAGVDGSTTLNQTAQGTYVPDEALHCVPAPTAVLTTTPGLDKSGTTVTVKEGDVVTFDASKSTAAGAAAGETLTTYIFDFGDGTTVSGTKPTVTHAYTVGGTFPASVKVTDSSGKVSTNTAQTTITVTAPPITAFSISERKNVPDSTFVTSEPVTLAGTAGQSYRISVANGDAPAMQYSINGGAFTASPGVISVGDTLVVRQLSAAKDATSQTSSVTIGNFTAGYKVTTGTTVDMVPDAFTFGETDNVAAGTVQTSKAVTPVNYDSAPVVAGPGMSYSISGGAYTTASGTITKGQSITARLTSSAGSLVYTRGYIAIGGVKGTFTTRNASTKK